MINAKLILHHAPSLMNEQIHINHEGCSAGEDTKKRLYIKRTHTGLVAFCHHCGESGFVRNRDHRDRLHKWLKAPPADAEGKLLPELADLSMHGIAWLLKYHCDIKCLRFSGIKDRPMQIGLKLFGANNEHTGWQIRNLGGHVPKYITHFIDLRMSNSSWFFNDNKQLFITEDYLSAYRIARDTKCSAVALLRTSLSDRTLKEISVNMPSMIHIWMDPDLPGRSAEKQIFKKLRFFLPNTTGIVCMNSPKEAKELSIEELEKIS